MSNEVEKLISLGLSAGGLSIADIRQTLPLDTMTVEEIESLVTRLEAAGVAVDIDPELLSPRPNRASAAPTGTAVPMAEQRTEPRQRPDRPAPTTPTANADAQRPFDLRPSRLYVRRSARKPLVLSIAILALALVALALWQLA